MSDNQLAHCAANSFRHSRAPDELKQRGMLGVEAQLRSFVCGGSPSTIISYNISDNTGLMILGFF